MLAGGPKCHVTAAMWVGMIGVGLPPTLFASRCIRQARRQGRLAPVLAADVLTMCAGMSLGHIAVPAHNPLFHHLSMLIGMLLGMATAGFALDRGSALFRKRRAIDSLPAHSSRPSL